jgi:hypothetical protein
MDNYIKPPIGLTPKFIFDMRIKTIINENGGISESYLKSLKEERLYEIKGAIVRYINANKHIDSEWLVEYNEILTELGVKKNEFKL